MMEMWICVKIEVHDYVISYDRMQYVVQLSLACAGCQGQLSQQPVTSAARDVVDSAVGMVETAKHLAASPQDQAAHHSYSALSHKLSDSIKNLLTAIR